MWSTSYVTAAGVTGLQYVTKGIFTDGGNYWLTKDEYTGHGFTIKLSDCKTSIVGIRIKNVAHPYSSQAKRATRGFSVYGALKDSGPWGKLLEGEFDSPLLDGAPEPSLQTFYFKEAVEMQFLRFDLDSYWGDKGGGLDYFAVITVSGNPYFIQTNELVCFKQTCANQPRQRALPITVDLPLLH